MQDLVSTHLSNFMNVSLPPMLTQLSSYSKQERLFLTQGPLQCCSPCLNCCSPWSVPLALQPDHSFSACLLPERLSLDSSIRTNSFLVFPVTTNNSFFLSEHFSKPIYLLVCFLPPLLVCKLHEGRILLPYSSPPTSSKAPGLQ